MSQSGTTLILIMAIAVLAPLLAYGVGRKLPVPLVIFEILLGILVGPDVLDWAHTDALIDGLSQLGLTMLIFLAGYEIEFGKVRGDTLRRSVWAWLIALALGLATGVLLGGGYTNGVFIGVALTSTALGTVLPVLRDAGDLHGRFGSVVMAFGAVGEFGPIIAMALLLSGRGAGESTVLLAVFAALTAGAVHWALRPRPPWFSRVIAKTLHTSGQFAVRFVFLLLAVMLGASQALGLDILLGAFAAGLITRLVLTGAAPESGPEILEKIEGSASASSSRSSSSSPGSSSTWPRSSTAAGPCSCSRSSCCSSWWCAAGRSGSSPRATSTGRTGADSSSTAPPRCRSSSRSRRSAWTTRR